MSDMKAPRSPGKRRTAKAQTRKVMPKVFTVRDLNRDTAGVLNAARQHGRIIIKSRGGDEYAVSRIDCDTKASTSIQADEDFAARQLKYREQMRALDQLTMKHMNIERLNRIIAGEE